MSRESAEKILMLEMSYNTTKHIEKIENLKPWIIDAMLLYHKEQLISTEFLNSLIESAKEMQDSIVKNQTNPNRSDICEHDYSDGTGTGYNVCRKCGDMY